MTLMIFIKFTFQSTLAFRHRSIRWKIKAQFWTLEMSGRNMPCFLFMREAPLLHVIGLIGA